MTERLTKLSFILTYGTGALALFFALSASAAPEAAPAPSEPISLEQILKNTLQKNAQIQEAMGDVEIARAQLGQAKAALWPKASVVALAGPMPEITGNPQNSNTNWSKWGGFVRGGAEVIEPLYTFGMISSYRRAAENQILARTELAEAKRMEVITTAKEMYYGFQMASELEALVEDVSKTLDEAVKTAEEDKDKDNGKKKKNAVKPHDLYKLKTSLEDLRQKKYLATAGRQTAERAIGWISLTPDTKLVGERLEPEKFEKKPVEEYLKLAKANRPEFRALHAGQEARMALRDAKRAQSYPVLFVGGLLSVGYSGVATKQQSTFANDPFNPLTGGVGVGLKFDLEFARHSAEAAEQEAEANKLKATENYAVPGIDLQVRKAYWEVEGAVASLEIAERRKGLGKKWFVGNAMGWSIGLTAAKDLLEALQGDAEAKKNYIETVYMYNMALAHLSQAIGVEVTDLKYR